MQHTIYKSRNDSWRISVVNMCLHGSIYLVISCCLASLPKFRADYFILECSYRWCHCISTYE